MENKKEYALIYKKTGKFFPAGIFTNLDEAKEGAKRAGKDAYEELDVIELTPKLEIKRYEELERFFRENF